MTVTINVVRPSSKQDRYFSPNFRIKRHNDDILKESSKQVSKQVFIWMLHFQFLNSTVDEISLTIWLENKLSNYLTSVLVLKQNFVTLGHF